MATKQKQQGQYMTPKPITDIILDRVGFTGENVLTKTIMEPSFGDGAFLSNIVSRIIQYAKQTEKSNQEIVKILNTNVFGIEKDPEFYTKAIERLNLILQEADIDGVTWPNLINGDTLVQYAKHNNELDLVVGNPPFVRIHNLEENYRELVKSFEFADGTTDLYVIFYELGLRMLNSTGKLGFISPNSFLKNTSQKRFRDYVVKNNRLSALYDFKSSKIFEDADTYTCICILDKNRMPEDTIEYREYNMYDILESNLLTYKDMAIMGNKPWTFASKSDMIFLSENKNSQMHFSDIALIQNAVATLRDSLYVVKAYCDKECTKPYLGKHTDNKRIVYFKNEESIIAIESTILHRCVKASKYDGKIDNTYIIMPYTEKRVKKSSSTDENPDFVFTYEAMTEKILQDTYPLAYNYLVSIKNELEQRDMDSHKAWFLYGRSQGIANAGIKKIVFKHSIEKTTKKIAAHIVPEDVVVYSGLYTTATGEFFKETENETIFDDTQYDKKLKYILTQMQTSDFARYCILTAKDMSGGYVSLSLKAIKGYGKLVSD